MKTASHHRLGLDRAIASSTVLHEEARHSANNITTVASISCITPWAVWSSEAPVRNSPHNSALKQRSKLLVDPVKAFLHKTYHLPRPPVRITGWQERLKLAQTRESLRHNNASCQKRWLACLRCRLPIRRDRHQPLGRFFTVWAKMHSHCAGPVKNLVLTIPQRPCLSC